MFFIQRGKSQGWAEPQMRNSDAENVPGRADEINLGINDLPISYILLLLLLLNCIVLYHNILGL